MTFDLTSEQELIRTTAREFAETQIKPIAAEIDRDSRFPHETVKRMGELGLMMKIGDEIITPPLSGTILAGVTRDSVLTLMREWGLRVSERPVTIDEVAAAARRGKLEEVWGTGTAAVISPVGELSYKGERIVINGGRIGSLTQKLYDTIVGIQYGTAPDAHGWTVPV